MESEFRQKQLELFSAGEEESNNRPFNRTSFINLNLTWENIILWIILCLMLVILSFSLGVEKGKKRIEPLAKNISANQPTLAQPKNEENKPLQPPLGAKKFTIQVASFEKSASLQGEINKLKRMGYDAWVVPSGRYNKLYVGRFATKEEAMAFQKKLQKIYNDCLIRRI